MNIYLSHCILNFLEVGAQGAFKSLCKEKQVGFFIVHINDEKFFFCW